MKCMFCGQLMPKGTGKLIVKRDGTIVSICSSKCEKNMFRLGRNPRKQKWITKLKGAAVIEAVPEEKERLIIRATEKTRRK